ncbi:MAG: hypothetical protein AAF466_06270 [Bacteroidota bacterium]
MELEEMKMLWQQMSQKLEQQRLVTDQIIIEMTQQKYSNRFNKLYFFESLGTVVCVAIAILILVNFRKLDTWYLVTCGAFVTAFLLVMPLLTLRSLQRIKRLSVSQFSYKEMLVRFEKSKHRVLLLQRGSLILSALLAVLILPVFQKIFKNEDLFQQDIELSLWISVGVMLLFLFFFARWGYRCYQSVTRSAEGILKELEE